MKSKLLRMLYITMAVVMAFASLSACAPAAEESGEEAPAAGEKIKIGISISDFATERWKPESDLLKQLLEEKGYEALVQEANHDVDRKSVV
jgi:ABC-type xylose transport system substrate-binding protein